MSLDLVELLSQETNANDLADLLSEQDISVERTFENPSQRPTFRPKRGKSGFLGAIRHPTKHPVGIIYYTAIVTTLIGLILTNAAGHIPHYADSVYHDIFPRQESTVERIPPPNLTAMVPSQWRAIEEKRLILDSKNDPVEVIADISQPANPHPEGTGDILALSWDPILKRWTTAFDFGRDKQSIQGTSQDFAFSNALPTDVQIETIPSETPGKNDLVVSANMVFPIGPPEQIVDVVHFSEQVARVAFQYENPGSGSVTVGHAQGRSLLQITAPYYTASDAHCCPARTMSFTVSPSAHDTYRLAADNRPWTGAYVVRDSLVAPSDFIVLSTTPGTPASKDLRPGDFIYSTDSPPSPNASSPDPSLLDEVASDYPGEQTVLHLIRNGIPKVVKVDLESLLSQETPVSDVNAPFGIGATFGTAAKADVAASVEPGTYITSISNGPILNAWPNRSQYPNPADPYKVRVVSINGQNVGDALQAYQLIAKSGGYYLTLELSIDGVLQTVSNIVPSLVGSGIYQPTGILPGYPTPF